MDKDKFATVMREFRDGKLKSSDGKTVTDIKQARAIAASESGMMPKRKEKSEEHDHEDGERCPYCDQAMPDKGEDEEDDSE